MSNGPDFASLGGWINDQAAVKQVLATLPYPLFSSAAPNLKGSGDGKTVLIYKAWLDVNKEYISYPAQTIGDCVSQSWSHAVDLLACVEIAIGREAEEFKQTATEFVYGTCRVDIGGQRGSYSDGAVGAWAAKAVSTIGTVSRDETGPYDGRRAKEWGAKGVPADLKAKAASHRVKTVSLVRSASEASDSLSNGHPVVVCSDQGFTMERDQNGFCRPRGTWNHAMLVAGVRADATPGFLIVQSWGDDVPSGPRTLDQPSYSFWITPDVMDRMLGQGDSFALSAFDGYPGRPMPSSWNWSDLAP